MYRLQSPCLSGCPKGHHDDRQTGDSGTRSAPRTGLSHPSYGSPTLSSFTVGPLLDIAANQMHPRILNAFPAGTCFFGFSHDRTSALIGQKAAPSTHDTCPLAYAFLRRTDRECRDHERRRGRCPDVVFAAPGDIEITVRRERWKRHLGYRALKRCAHVLRVVCQFSSAAGFNRSVPPQGRFCRTPVRARKQSDQRRQNGYGPYRCGRHGRLIGDSGGDHQAWTSPYVPHP